MSFFKKTSTPPVIEHDQEYACSDTHFYGPQHPAMMAYATVARRTVRDHLEDYVEVHPFARAEPTKKEPLVTSNVYTSSKNEKFKALLQLFSEKNVGPFSLKMLANSKGNDAKKILKARKKNQDGIYEIYKSVVTNNPIETKNFEKFYNGAITKSSGLKSQFERDKIGEEYDELRYALVIRAMIVGNNLLESNADTITAYQNIFNGLTAPTKKKCGVTVKLSSTTFTGDDLQQFMKKKEVYPLDVLQGK